MDTISAPLLKIPQANSPMSKFNPFLSFSPFQNYFADRPSQDNSSTHNPLWKDDKRSSFGVDAIRALSTSNPFRWTGLQTHSEVKVHEIMAVEHQSYIKNLTLKDLFRYVLKIGNNYEIDHRHHHHSQENEKEDPNIENLDALATSYNTSIGTPRSMRTRKFSFFSPPLERISEATHVNRSSLSKYGTSLRRSNNLQRLSSSIAASIGTPPIRSFAQNFLNDDNSSVSSIVSVDDDDIEEDTSLNAVKYKDFRSLDFNVNPCNRPEILIRRNVVIVILDPIRAIVMADRLLLIVPEGFEHIVSAFKEHIQGWTDVHIRRRLGTLTFEERFIKIPFEIFAFEAILIVLGEIQKQHLSQYQTTLKADLEFFSSGLIFSTDEQEAFRKKKEEIDELAHRIISQRSLAEALLESDEAMVLMNVTSLAMHPRLYKTLKSDKALLLIDEIENLIESYLPESAVLLKKANEMLCKIKDMEQLIFTKLNKSQNDVLLVQMSAAALTASIGFSGYIASAFGMNLTLKVLYGSFTIVFVISGGMIVLSWFVVRWYFEYIGIIAPSISPRLIALDVGRALFSIVMKAKSNINAFVSGNSVKTSKNARAHWKPKQ